MLLHLLAAGFSVLPCAKSVSSVPRAARRSVAIYEYVMNEFMRRDRASARYYAEGWPWLQEDD
jgi:hypothetical protein